jgi:hypothetical protein
MSIESMFERALKNIKKHHLEDMFVNRAEKIVRDTSGIGWGFADNIEYLHSQYFK